MATRPMKIVACLQLTRVGLALTAVSNIWLVAWIARADEAGERRPILEDWAILLTTGCVAVGIYIFGMTLNDLLDLRRDRVLSPQRPLPSGRVSQGTAMALALGALLMGVAASVPLGQPHTLLCIAVATAILFYNGPGKHIAGVGILSLGLIRAGHMLIAEPTLGYLWPVWLTMTHVIGLSALCHRLEDKRPGLFGGQVWVVTLGWAFVSVGMIGWMKHLGTLTYSERPWVLLGPGVAAAAFLIVIAYTLMRSPTPQAAGATLMKRGLVWLIVYDAAWLAGLGFWYPAAIHTALLVITWALMLIIKRLASTTHTPMGFQR